MPLENEVKKYNIYKIILHHVNIHIIDQRIALLFLIMMLLY